MAGAINALKDFDGKVSGVNQGNILIELNRISHRQFAWQENSPVATLVRYHKIFNTDIINEICLSLLGINLEQVYLCGIALVSAYLHDPMLNTPIRSEIAGLSNEVAKKFLSFTCRPVFGLRQLLQSEQRYDQSFSYAYNSVRAYPIVAMKVGESNSLICPIPMLLIWRFTAALYYELAGDRRFSNAFGASFQAYVGEMASRAFSSSTLHLVPEQRYGGKKARKHTADWIVTDTDAAIFLECKGKRVSWSGKVALDDLDALESDLARMADAIVQLYKTIDDYRNGHYQHFQFDPTRRIFPVVVTLEDWHIFLETARKVFDLVRARLAEIDMPLDVLNEMPYSIWWIGDLEASVQIISQIGISAFMDGKIRDPEMSRWEWQAYMAHEHKGKFSRKKLLRSDYDAIFAKIIDGAALRGLGITPPRSV